jgi:amino acid adenylation domain-containing protein
MPYLLHQLLQKSAQQWPEQQAVCYKNDYLSYAQLDTQSNQLAILLQQSGVKRGDRVGIYLEKSPVYLVAIFGILKAGAVYVPLDPGAPKQRIAFIINNSEMQAIISCAAKVNGLNSCAGSDLNELQKIILADNALELTANLPQAVGWNVVLEASVASLADSELIENDLAYILYTSGSTGVPKGVMISHSASLTFVNWAYETFQVHSNDRVANHAPFHFDLSIFDVFTTIKAGATVVLVPSALSVFPRSLADFIAKENISIWYSVPSVLMRLVLYGQLERHEYPRLRTVLFAGEVFPIKYLRQLMQLLPKPTYFNLYGPTETNVCTYYEVPNDLPESMTALPIGKACANTEIVVLNEQQIVQHGEEGELCVRSPSVMTGYWKLPEKTAESLVPFTFHTNIGVESIYRTGDFVKQGTDGNYVYLGRRDNMIKSNGYRIELGEIEAALYGHSDVQEVAVITVPDDEIGNRIKAFVVLAEGMVLQQKILQGFCADRLPSYMIPHMLEFVKSLPKTSTGKIDKTALKKVSVAEASSSY